VFGDEDGVVIVAAERAEEIAVKAVEKARADEAREDRLRRGETMKQVLGY
jgi:regulator of RNase E activity RraA